MRRRKGSGFELPGEGNKASLWLFKLPIGNSGNVSDSPEGLPLPPSFRALLSPTKLSNPPYFPKIGETAAENYLPPRPRKIPEKAIDLWRGKRKRDMAPSLALSTAEKLREDGNTYFKKDRFRAAIDAYTEAITLCPNVPVYWTNRALCHRKFNEWTRVEEDSRKAVQLDNNSVKGHYMLGLSLLQKQEYADGVKALERALDLGRGANPNGYMVEEIWQELAKAKYMEWEDTSSKRSWELQNLKEACETALIDKHDAFEMEGFLDEAGTNRMKQLEALGRVFEKAAEADTPSEVPDYLCCKITLEIFRDPVITPSGVTYERSVILDHLEKGGKFDPTTRDPLDESQLIPNLAIKEAVEAYLKEHGWAYGS